MSLFMEFGTKLVSRLFAFGYPDARKQAIAVDYASSQTLRDSQNVCAFD